MNRTLLLPALLFISISCYAQKKKAPLAMDSLFVYRDLFTGGTTNAVANYSRMADTMQEVTKVKVEKAELDTLNILLKSVSSKHHYQQKIGPTHYALAYNNGEKHRLSVIKGFGFIDMSVKREYSFRNTVHQEIFNRFVERNY